MFAFYIYSAPPYMFTGGGSNSNGDSKSTQNKAPGVNGANPRNSEADTTVPLNKSRLDPLFKSGIEYLSFWGVHNF